ncbi:MAG: hypothetical protein C0490_09385, partial [Marivirga sp.]|nr:hypothetical protein [Marivirga sp.]
MLRKEMKRIIFSAIACMAMLTALAQQPAKLSFKEAVKIGLQNNVVLNQQKNKLAYTQVNKTSTLLQFGPSVEA